MWSLVRRLMAAERWASRARRREGYDGQVPPFIVLHVACVEGVPDGGLIEALKRAGLVSGMWNGAENALRKFHDPESIGLLLDSELRLKRRALRRLINKDN